MSRHTYLDPVALAKIRDLRLIARTAIDGNLHGIHASRQRGAGLEFNQYRQYEPGDEPRQIDWKLYARSDRLFVRQSERESQLNVWFLLDLSASMAQTSGQIDRWSKLDYARTLIACLAYAVHRQGDACGMMGLNTTHMTHVPARSESRHMDGFFLELENLQCGGRWPSAGKLRGLWEALRKPGLVVLVSDFFQHNGEIESLLARLVAAGREVLTVQLLTRDELSFPHRGQVAFVDRETGERVLTDAATSRGPYLARLQNKLDGLATALAGIGIDHRQLIIEQPLDAALWHFLHHRSLSQRRGNTRPAQRAIG